MTAIQIKIFIGSYMPRMFGYPATTFSKTRVIAPRYLYSAKIHLWAFKGNQLQLKANIVLSFQSFIFWLFPYRSFQRKECYRYNLQTLVLTVPFRNLKRLSKNNARKLTTVLIKGRSFSVLEGYRMKRPTISMILNNNWGYLSDAILNKYVRIGYIISKNLAKNSMFSL